MHRRVWVRVYNWRGLAKARKYSGVVIFDRWDMCFLLSGGYISYVADSVKSELRPYRGKAMQVDASQVVQFENPGDAVILKYTIIGSAPDNRRGPVTDGLVLSTLSDFDSHGTPTFTIKIGNEGSSTIEIDSSEIGPTLMGSTRSVMAMTSDIHSAAWNRRGSLVDASAWSSTVDGVNISATYIIEPPLLPRRFDLRSNSSIEARITLKVSPGQYQFMVGYGGGVHEEKSIASNAISFELSNHGVATLDH
jgi:hypothetical protein